MDDTSSATIILIIGVLLLVSGLAVCVFSLFFAKKPLIVCNEARYKNWQSHQGDVTAAQEGEVRARTRRVVEYVEF